MSLLESFFDVGASQAPVLFGVTDDEPEASRRRDKDRGRGRGRVDPDAEPMQAFEAALSAADVDCYRRQLAFRRRAWLTDEQRDPLTACFVASV
ncbi:MULTISPECIES: hypothetical protein [unclassified Caballeronia]|uniref:hypothetical protein n=1 Tax=unclassified Caballeronia TaxID=2646786 RepID=UPI00202783F5|nr:MULTISPECIES: hypothetical protein [unclassified Caballeronia]